MAENKDLSNRELAEIAGVTEDTELQEQLADHPSSLVTAMLLRNPNLAPEIKSRLDRLIKSISEPHTNSEK